MTYNTNFPNGVFGCEVCIDLIDCNTDKFNPEDLSEFVTKVIEVADMKAHGDPVIWRDTETEEIHLRGTSLFQWIQTSNIVIHTLELTGLALFNLFTCKPFDVDKVWMFAEEFFEAQEVNVTVLDRGIKK